MEGDGPGQPGLGWVTDGGGGGEVMLHWWVCCPKFSTQLVVGSRGHRQRLLPR